MPKQGSVEYDRFMARFAYAEMACGRLTHRHCERTDDHDPHGDPNTEWCDGREPIH